MGKIMIILRFFKVFDKILKSLLLLVINVQGDEKHKKTNIYLVHRNLKHEKHWKVTPFS